MQAALPPRWHTYGRCRWMKLLSVCTIHSRRCYRRGHQHRLERVQQSITEASLEGIAEILSDLSAALGESVLERDDARPARRTLRQAWLRNRQMPKLSKYFRVADMFSAPAYLGTRGSTNQRKCGSRPISKQITKIILRWTWRQRARWAGLRTNDLPHTASRYGCRGW